MITTPPINNTSFASSHKLKREKLLACEYNGLSQYDIKVLIQHCHTENNVLVERLLLASLFTGRAIENLTQADVKTRILDNIGFSILVSSLKFPDWKKELSVNSQSHGSIPPFVFLPTKIIQSIETALKLNSEELVKEAKALLGDLNSQHRSRLTLSRINNYLRTHATKCGLSQAEVNFISNTPLNHHGGSSYLSMSSEELTPKHYKYINTLMTIACQHHLCIDLACHHPIAKVRMGSNFSVPETIIKSTIKELTRSIDKYQKYGRQETANRWSLFNCYTYYTLILLNMCTGHRPTRSPYGELSSFDLLRNVVFIEDKRNREESGRVLPLNASAVKQLEQYLSFLKRFVTTIQYTDPDAASILHKALQGQECLFYLRVGRGLKPFSISSLKKCGIPVIKAKSNWNRHWIRSSLALSIDLNPSAIDAFMGHENLLDESFSRFSTLDMSEIRSVAEAIQHELSSLEIEPLEVSL